VILGGDCDLWELAGVGLSVDVEVEVDWMVEVDWIGWCLPGVEGTAPEKAMIYPTSDLMDLKQRTKHHRVCHDHLVLIPL
jgi:hypothetical protein